MRISTVQTRQKFAYNVNNPGKLSLQEIKKNANKFLDMDLQLIESACSKSDIVVTIEAINTSLNIGDNRYNFADSCDKLDSENVDKFARLAKKHSCYIVAGLLTNRNDNAYNSAILFDKNGQIADIYDKIHLVPGLELDKCTCGTEYKVTKTEFGNIGMLICWDLQMPEAARITALKGADLIAVPTWGWESIFRARAYENSVNLAVAMGISHSGSIWDFCDASSIVDNMGTVRATATMSDEMIVTSEIDIRKKPSFQYGNVETDIYKNMQEYRFFSRQPTTYEYLLK